MKVALCFFGFMRHYERLHLTWKHNFIDKYKADVYISTCDSESYKSEAMERYGPQFDLGNSLDIENVTKLYAPSGILMEPYDDHHEKIVCKAKLLTKNADAFASINQGNRNLIQRDRPVSAVSMWYKWYSLFKTFRTELMKYDIVFLTRSDFQFNGSIELTLDPHFVMTPPWPGKGGHHEGHINYDIGINDWWIYGDPKSMLKFCKLFRSLKTVVNLVHEEYGLWESTNIHGLPYQNAMLEDLDVGKSGEQLGNLLR